MTDIVVISPHPDDEAIGCGGTIRKHVLTGDAVHTIFLTSGEAGGHGRLAEDTLQLREREARHAADILGLATIEFWREPDGHLRAHSLVVERLRRTLDHLRPSLLYVTHEKEMHPDHRAAMRIVRRAVSTLNGSVPEVWMYEVWTPLQTMDRVEDISQVIQDKVKAVRAYRTQCDAMRFDEAVLGLNRYRGEMHSWPGGDYAEIFRTLRFFGVDKRPASQRSPSLAWTN
jgi:N-acetylglucosamine malate deacetylase 1